MKTFKLPIIAVAAAMLTGCGFSGANDEPLTAAPAATATPITTTTTAPVATEDMATHSPAPVKPDDSIQTNGAHIDASAFLNALVESGCQIDKAEYKEVKRGGAIKVVCSKTLDALNVELDDL
jgi:PBP1b-binding outer membrane lipoprotein LpoB